MPTKVNSKHAAKLKQLFHRDPGPSCWAERLSPEAKTFLVEASDLYKEKPETFNLSSLYRIMKQEFKITVGYQQITRHVQGRCRCRV